MTGSLVGINANRESAVAHAYLVERPTRDVAHALLLLENAEAHAPTVAPCGNVCRIVEILISASSSAAAKP